MIRASSSRLADLDQEVIADIVSVVVVDGFEVVDVDQQDQYGLGSAWAARVCPEYRLTRLNMPVSGSWPSHQA